MNKLSKRHFWEWFRRHQNEYLELHNKTKKEASYWLNELNAHLRAYYKFFGYSLIWSGKGIARLTITVNGKAMHFKKVDAFVATAPEIPGWCIQALEDPMPVDFLLEQQIEETGIHPNEFYFSFAGDDTNMIVYHPLCTNYNAHAVLDLAYEAVYNLLGERAFGTELGDLEVDNLSCADRDAVHKLSELPTHIAGRRSGMVVDGNGALLDKG